jgi:hypothetical protein
MKSPRPPDPYATAGSQQRAETGAAIGSSIIGNPNVYTPYGSQTYSIAGWEQVPDAQGRMISVPRYNQVQQLSPDQQRLLGLQTQGQYNLGQTAVEQSAKLRNLLGQSVSTAGLTGWNQGPQSAKLATSFGGQGAIRQDQGPTDRAAIENAMMSSYNRQRNPQNAAENAQLAARGLSPGGAGYGTVQQGREDAYSEAARQAYLASGQESRQAQDAYNQAQQQRYQEAMQRAGFSNEALAQMFNMGGSAADRQNALRQQQLQETLALRNQPLNEISALLAGGQVTLPSFNPFQSQGINSANIAGQIGQNYAAQSQQANAFNSGLFGLASAGLGGWLGR